MTEAICPGCGEQVSLEGLTAGNRMDCPNCANLTLRLTAKDCQLVLAEVFKVSCPSCDRVMEVPDGLGPGDTLKCCGQSFTLTYEFGAYALVPGHVSLED